MKKLLIALFAFSLCLFILTSCGKDDDTDLAEIAQEKLENVTSIEVTEDDLLHNFSVDAPEGTYVKYYVDGQEFAGTKEAGTYQVTIKLFDSKTNKELASKTLTLKINAKEVAKVRLTSIDASSDGEDFEGDGTEDSPYTFDLAAGTSVVATLLLAPNNAENKELEVTYGSYSDGKFVASENDKITTSFANGKVTFESTSDITDGQYGIKLSSKDGSNLSLFFEANVIAYVAATEIKSNTLTKVEGQEYDYEMITLKGTHWDMTNGQTERGAALMEGTLYSSIYGLQCPRNLIYYPCVYNFDLEVCPANATSKDLSFKSSNEDVVVAKNGGAFETKNAGEAIITITAVNDPTVSTKIKVTVIDSLYAGIEKTIYDEAAVATHSDWDLDSNHGTQAQFDLYDEWHLVMMQSNQSTVFGTDRYDDHNQKIFYMGTYDRPYGICLENGYGYYIGYEEDPSRTSPVVMTEAGSMIWAKVTVPEGAEELKFKISSNSLDHYAGKFRVLFVDENGNVTVLKTTDSQEEFTLINQQKDSYPSYAVPESIRGTQGALVIEHFVTEQNINSEFQIKRIYFAGYTAVTSVSLESSETVSKPGKSVQIVASVNPSDASNKTITYSVKDNVEGITVSETGLVTIGEDVSDGEYEIICTSADNENATATYKITVQSQDIYVTKWGNKSEILNGVGGTSWEVVGKYDSGVGEGADLHVDGTDGWSSLKLSDREIREGYEFLTYDARVFVRSGETNPRIQVKITDGETVTIIKAIGTDLDYVELDTLNKRYDDYNYYTYDLSAFVSKTVTVEIGITQGTHSPINFIEFHNSDVTTVTGTYVKAANGDTTVTLYNTLEKAKEYTIVSGADPRNATNGFVTIELASEYENVTLEGDKLTINPGVAVGEYKVICKSVADPSITSEFVVIIEEEPQEVPDPTVWANKDAILEDWTVSGAWDSGVGEGVDLHVDGTDGWSSIVLDNRTIKNLSYVLNVGARVFVRAGETNPRFVVKVTTDKGNIYTIKALGATEDYVELDTTDAKYDSANHYYYDLSQFIGMTVKVEVGITQGSHSVITDVRFDGTANITWGVKDQQGKKDMIISEDALNAWTIVGSCDSGVGEGVDIKELGTYLTNTISIGNYYNNLLTFQGRVFHRDGETYPEISVIVVDGDTETTITANGLENEYVYFDQDNLATFTYDLSAFAGKTVEVRIQLHNGATHCVITYIGMSASRNFIDIDPYKFEWDGKDAILADWEVVGSYDAGVGEGADLHVDGTDGWSSLKLDEREIRTTSYLLKVGARVFVRAGETNPRFVVKVVSEVGNEYIIQAFGQTEDYVEFDTTNAIYDSTYYIYYDLSQFIGQKVTIEFGVTQGSHSVVQYFGFTGTENVSCGEKGQQGGDNKTALVSNWTVNGNYNSGVGEGVDLQTSDASNPAYISRTISIGKYYNNILTIQGRIFNGQMGDPAVYPQVQVVVVDGENQTIITANGTEGDTVELNGEDVNALTFTYDLSAFASKTVEVRIVMVNATYHCVLTYVGMNGSETFHEVDPKRLVWDGKDAILADWEVVGKYDSGVGEGADLHVDGTDGWSSLKLEKNIDNTSYVLKVGARVFVRGGETNPRFVLKINNTVVQAFGQTEDYVEFDTTNAIYDSTYYIYYDLSQFIGQKVTIEFGVTQGTHSVVQYFGFAGTEDITWGEQGEQGGDNKTALVSNWTVNGNYNSGVGEGIDLQTSDPSNPAYISKTISIGSEYNTILTLQGRIFNGQMGDPAVYPQVQVVVVDGENQTIITANGAFGNTVELNGEDVNALTFTYDLSAFAGKTVEVRIVMVNATYHCVLTYIGMSK